MEIDLNNIIFHVEDLTMERVMAEHGITEESRRQFPDLYKQFVEDFIPTRKDLERKIDEDGLKELCLRVPCRVLMHRWNPVHRFVTQFTRQGRIQRWSKEKTHKQLAKAVHRYKDTCPYNDRDIRMLREREWCERKKENLMRLAVWEYDKKQQQQQQEANEQTAGGEGEEQLQSNSCPMHVNDKNNIDNNAKNIANYKTADPIKDDDMETLVVNEEIIQENFPTQVEGQSSDTLPMQPLSQSTTMNFIDLNKNALIKITPTVPNSPPSTPDTANSFEQEYLERYGSEPRQVDYFNFNTESMHLDQSTSTSEEIFSDEPQYCDFNTDVSAQSPIY